MALAKITSITGRGLAVPGNDIDTDRIIPARFLKAITFDALDGELIKLKLRAAHRGVLADSHPHFITV